MGQNKAVVVVYDDSGSMGKGPGSRCNAVSYAIQVLTALITEKDQMFVVKMSDIANPVKIDLTQKQKAIKDMEPWMCNYGTTPIGSVLNSMELCKKIKADDISLLIFTDGVFEDLTESDLEKIENYLKAENTKFLLLNIDEFKGQFTSAIKNMGVKDVFYAKSNCNDIIQSMEEVSTSLMTLDNKGLIPQSVNKNFVELNSIYPLKRLIVLNQTTNKKINTVTGAFYDKNKLDISFAYDVAKDNLKARITHVVPLKENDVIPRGSINMVFKEAVNLKELKFLPLVALKLNENITGDFFRVDGNNYFVCDDNNKVEVQARITTEADFPIEKELLKEIDCKIYIDGKEYPMNLKDTLFTYAMEVKNAMKVSVSAEHKGYFYFRSKVYFLNKEKCPEVKLPQNIIYPPFKVTEYLSDSGVYIQPLVDGKPTNLELLKKYKLKLIINSDAPLEIITTNDYWQLKYKQEICPCFAPTTKKSVEIQLMSEYKQKILDTSRFDIDIQNVSFFKKCLFPLLVVLGLLVLLIYFSGLQRKRRFAREGKITVTDKGNLFTKERKYDYMLRKRSTLSWFNRWFNPFSVEHFNYSNERIGHFVFYAGPTINKILVSKADYLVLSQNSTEQDNINKKYINIVENEEFSLPDKRSPATSHVLAYNAGNKANNDIRWAKLFYSFLKMLSVLIAGLLIYYHCIYLFK